MEDDKHLVAEAEIEDDKASNTGTGSTASHCSEEYVKGKNRVHDGTFRCRIGVNVFAVDVIAPNP